MTEDPSLPSDSQIRRYLELAAAARKHAQAPYAGLFTVIPPDPETTMIKEFAIVYALIGVLLFLLALVSAIQAFLANENSPIVRTA